MISSITYFDILGLAANKKHLLEKNVGMSGLVGLAAGPYYHFYLD